MVKFRDLHCPGFDDQGYVVLQSSNTLKTSDLIILCFVVIVAECVHVRVGTNKFVITLEIHVGNVFCHCLPYCKLLLVV